MTTAEPRYDAVHADAAPADPMELVREWLPGNDEPERPQVTLATIGDDGFPSARTVLLTEFDDTGLYFHTDAESRKVREIAGNPRVCIVVLWPGFTRQLVVQGLAEVADAAEISAAFARRSPYLKQLAWQNTADFARLPLEQRLERWARFGAEHGVWPQPANWVGFRVRPVRLLFWASNPDTASRRLEYTRTGETWALDRLPG